MILSILGKFITTLAFPAVTTALADTSASANDWEEPSRPAYSSVTIQVLIPKASAFLQFIIKSESGFPKPSSDIITPSKPK